MSTTTGVRREDEIECPTDLRAFLCGLEADSSLFLPGQLRERLIVLDDLDAGFGGFDSEDSTRCTDSRLHQRAKALRPFWFLMFADPRFRLFNSIRESRSVKNPFAVSILPSIIAPGDLPKTPVASSAVSASVPEQACICFALEKD